MYGKKNVMKHAVPLSLVQRMSQTRSVCFRADQVLCRSTPYEVEDHNLVGYSAVPFDRATEQKR